MNRIQVFKITSPDGKILDSKTIKVATIQTSEQYVSTSTDPANVQKRIEYTCKPNSKLGKGTYKIEVYKKDTYLGENQFKLN